MDVQHRDNNPGSAEVQKRALTASAGKETQQEHTQKLRGSAVKVNLVPQALFGGKPCWVSSRSSRGGGSDNIQ